VLISAAIRHSPPDLPLAFEFLEDSQMDKVELREACDLTVSGLALFHQSLDKERAHRMATR
jgi:hypothetical protein